MEALHLKDVGLEQITDVIRRHAPAHDRDVTAPTEALDILRDSGLNGLAIAPGLPNSLDATNREVVETCIELGKGGLSDVGGWIMHQVAAGFTRSPNVDEATKERLATRLGEHLYATPTSEPHTRTSDMITFLSKSMAVDMGDAIGIQPGAKKKFASNWEVSSRALFTCHMGSETLIVDVDSNDPNFEPIDDWDVPGMRSTRSISFAAKGLIRVAKDKIIMRTPTEQFLPAYMGPNGLWTFGWMTGAQIGALRRGIELAAGAGKAKYDQRLGESKSDLDAAESLLLRAADMYDDPKVPAGHRMEALVSARNQTIRRAADIRNNLARIMGAHGRLGPASGTADGEFDRLSRDLEMGILTPPDPDDLAAVLGRLARGLPPM